MQLLLRFAPEARIPRFSQPVVLQVCSLARPLLLVDGSCIAMDVKLEADQARAVVRTIDLSAHEDVWDDRGRDRQPVAVGAESIQVATRPDDPWAPNSSVRIRRWDA